MMPREGAGSSNMKNLREAGGSDRLEEKLMRQLLRTGLVQGRPLCCSVIFLRVTGSLCGRKDDCAGDRVLLCGSQNTLQAEDAYPAALCPHNSNWSG